jgi:ATP-binding cassette subfamily F protein 3
VLEDFSGTILLVSHDRYLVDRLATHIWELRESKLETFQGTYREFVLRRSTSTSLAQARQVLLPPKPLVRDNSRETRQRVRDLNMLEERIREQELAVRRLSSELQRAGGAENGRRYERISHLSQEFAKAQAALESLMSEWEKLAV